MSRIISIPGGTVELPDDVTDEYAEGYAASYNDEIRRDDNPFHPFSSSWYEWRDGYVDGMEEQ